MNPIAFLFLLMAASLGGMFSRSSGKDVSEAGGALGASSNATEDSDVTAVTLPDGPEQPGTPYEPPTPDPIEITHDGTHQIVTGRVSILEAQGDDITEVRIVSGVEHGTVTVNADNTIAVVMTMEDFVGTQDFVYEVTHADGAVTQHEVELDVTVGAQAGGWGTGASHYMLETDEDDRIIVEHGEVHAKVYVSGDPDALSIADIAALEGVAVSTVTGSWLAENTDYGQSEGEALAEDAGRLLWKALTPSGSDTSHWLLLERGYEYDELGRLLSPDVNGEDELHPLYIGAWGEGEKPEITTEFRQYQESSENVVIQDIHFTGNVFLLSAKNIIFDNILVSEDKFSIQQSESITIRNSEFLDIFREDSLNGGDWEPHLDRISAIYINSVDGFLMENTLVDHAGWEEGYDPDQSGADGQPPSQYSQNIYLGDVMTDVTMRDVITMRGASWGAQVRSGGFIEDNVFLDNNAGFHTVGGDYQGKGHIGEYSLITNNVVTSGAHKLATQIGAKTYGLEDRGALTSLVDNIVAHLADPNNPEELEEKPYTDTGLRTDNAYFDNTIVWNWEGSETVTSDRVVTEQNADALDANIANQTTIQQFTAILLGNPDATIADLANYLRNKADGALDDLVDADLIISFFQKGFGISTDLREEEATLRFTPDVLGEGVRWDNRLNWDTNDLPGTQDGDSVDLAGNHVVYGGTTTIKNADMGEGGRLDIHHGKLTVDTALTAGDAGADVNIDGSGQLWLKGYDGSGALDLNMSGGRFVNTGQTSNTDVTASGGQTVLATGGTEFDLTSGNTLAVESSTAKVGFDGDDGGIAILDMHNGADVTFSSRDGDLGQIGEFRTGAMGDNTNVLSGVDLGNATLTIDLTGLNASTGNTFTLIESDEIVGTFNEVKLTGLGARDAEVTIDYQTDSVSLALSAGTGNISVATLGDEDDHESQALWDALTQNQEVIPEESALVDEDEDLADLAA